VIWSSSGKQSWLIHTTINRQACYTTGDEAAKYNRIIGC
jgi:hypothetical protein